MADYKKMYHRLFNAATNAISLLQAAQSETEEIYINSKPVVLELLKIQSEQTEIIESEAVKSDSQVN
jgi:hypothetical protein